MKTRNLFSIVAAFALAFAAGSVLASPDVATALWHGIVAHADIGGGLVLAWGPLVRGLQAQQADAADRMRAIVAKAESEDRDLNAEEQTEFDGLKVKSEGLKGRIARAQETELMEAGVDRAGAAAAAAHTSDATLAQQQRGTAVVLPTGARLAVEENVERDPQRGFQSLGDFARNVRLARTAQHTGTAIDQRLQPLAAAPGTYGGESVGADGGFLIPPGFSTSIFNLSLAEDSLLPLTDVMTIDGNTMSIPKDETTPWGTNGIRAYWQGEGQAGTGTKPSLGLMELRLKKLMGLVAVTDELAADASALASWLPGQIARSIRWKANEAIFFGAGNGTPLGALTSLSNNQGALITVAKDAGQATGTLLATNLANMIARLPSGSYPRAVWVVNNDVLPALFTLTLGNYPIYLPGGATVGGIQSNPYGMLLGRPIIVSQHAKSFSSQGDVMLLDLSYYQTITKAEGIQTATSMHLYFDADSMAFRTTFRMDGQPKLVAPINPANGSNKLSPFVQLGAR